MCADPCPPSPSLQAQELDALGALLQCCLTRLDALQLHLEGAYVDLALQSLVARLLPPDETAQARRRALH